MLYGPGGALWASNTNGQPVGATIMQGDGNLVIYGPDAATSGPAPPHGNPGADWSSRTTATWSSTAPTAPPLWATNTADHRRTGGGEAMTCSR